MFPPGLDAPDNYVQECAVHGALYTERAGNVFSFDFPDMEILSEFAEIGVRKCLKIGSPNRCGYRNSLRGVRDFEKGFTKKRKKGKFFVKTILIN